MILKGSARGGAGELADHLLRKDTNERVRILKLSGLSSSEIREALAELNAMGAGSRSRRTLYHASINMPVGEDLTPEQLDIAIARMAKKLELEDQPYIVVEHEKKGRRHYHVVWSRINTETGKAIPDSHNYRRHEEVARELEKEFGHQPVLGAHVRDKTTHPRPERGPTWGEQRQAERSGITPEEAKKQITALWQQTTTGSAFAEALAAEGWTLARGERRDFVLLDPAGEVHSLARRIEGTKAAQVRERMADVNAEQFPTVEEARQRPTIEPEPPTPAPPSPPPDASHHAAAAQPPPDVEQPQPNYEQQARAQEIALARVRARKALTAALSAPVPAARPPDAFAQAKAEVTQPLHESAMAQAKKLVIAHVLPELAKLRNRTDLFVHIYGLLTEAYDKVLERGRALLPLFSGNRETALAPLKPSPRKREVLTYKKPDPDRDR